MSEEAKWYQVAQSVPNLIERVYGLRDGAFHARLEMIDSWRKAHHGRMPSPKDPRLRAKSVSQVVRGEGIGHNRLPLGFNADVLLTTEMSDWQQTWSFAGGYQTVKRELQNAGILCSLDLQHAMFELIPHTIRIVTVVWCGEFVLMQLKHSGTKENPASTIQFPHASLLGFDESFETAAERIAKSPFSPFITPNWDVQLEPTWRILTPNRPEIILVRHAQFIGDPSKFYRPWTECSYYPNVWVNADAVGDATCGDSTELIRNVRIADRGYRSRARSFMRVPPKSSLTVTDKLVLDEVSTEVAQTVDISSLKLAI